MRVKCDKYINHGWNEKKNLHLKHRGHDPDEKGDGIADTPKSKRHQLRQQGLIMTMFLHARLLSVIIEIVIILRTCQLSPIFETVFSGSKSLKPIAAKEFKPLLIVLK